MYRKKTLEGWGRDQPTLSKKRPKSVGRAPGYNGSGFNLSLSGSGIVIIALVGATATGFATGAIPNTCKAKGWSACSFEAQAAGSAELPLPVDSTAELPSATNRKVLVGGIAQYVIGPKSVISDTKTVTDNTNGKKHNVTTINVGTTIRFPDEAKFTDVMGKGVQTNQITAGKFALFLCKNTDPKINGAFVNGLRNTVDEAQKHADGLQAGIKHPSAAELKGAENAYSIAPYTSVPDNPNIPNVQTYSAETIRVDSKTHKPLAHPRLENRALECIK